MRKSCLLYLFFLFTFSLQAQIKNDTITTVATDVKIAENIFDCGAVDRKPEFRGGTQALQSYLARSIRYPQISLENGSQGRTVVRFIINADGTVASPEVVRTSGDLNLDMEALRVVETMPKWKPGRIGKKKVRVYFVIPIVFILR
ncbi:MAG: energy transducer TonB [Bacteroidaceae bacterium]|nr:energy transducer TonB [Bacteroidaceae bacterium]